MSAVDAAEAGRLETMGATELLCWALGRFGAPALTLASSFGAEDCVLIDLFAELGRFPRVVTIDTGRLPEATHAVIEEIRRKYSLRVELLFPDAAAVEAMAARHGPNLFYERPDLRALCCDVRKVRPLGRALSGASAWITGLRREQSAERAAVPKAAWDERFGLLKLNPLADWTGDQVWERLRARGVPYNRLHDQGYPSVGCAPCTRAVAPGEDPRSGRWWWESAGVKECGLHRRPV